MVDKRSRESLTPPPTCKRSKILSPTLEQGGDTFASDAGAQVSSTFASHSITEQPLVDASTSSTLEQGGDTFASDAGAQVSSTSASHSDNEQPPIEDSTSGKLPGLTCSQVLTTSDEIVIKESSESQGNSNASKDDDQASSPATLVTEDPMNELSSQQDQAVENDSPDSCADSSSDSSSSDSSSECGYERDANGNPVCDDIEGGSPAPDDADSDGDAASDEDSDVDDEGLDINDKDADEEAESIAGGGIEDEDPVPPTPNVPVASDDIIVLLGKIETTVNPYLCVKAHNVYCLPGDIVPGIDTPVCLGDRTLIGTIMDTFGDPKKLYFKIGLDGFHEKVQEHGLQEGTEIYYFERYVVPVDYDEAKKPEVPDDDFTAITQRLRTQNYDGTAREDDLAQLARNPMAYEEVDHSESHGQTRNNDRGRAGDRGRPRSRPNRGWPGGRGHAFGGGVAHGPRGGAHGSGGGYHVRGRPGRRARGDFRGQAPFAPFGNATQSRYPNGQPQPFPQSGVPGGRPMPPAMAYDGGYTPNQRPDSVGSQPVRYPGAGQQQSQPSFPGSWQGIQPPAPMGNGGGFNPPGATASQPVAASNPYYQPRPGSSHGPPGSAPNWGYPSYPQYGGLAAPGRSPVFPPPPGPDGRPIPPPGFSGALMPPLLMPPGQQQNFGGYNQGQSYQGRGAFQNNRGGYMQARGAYQQNGSAYGNRGRGNAYGNGTGNGRGGRGQS